MFNNNTTINVCLEMHNVLITTVGETEVSLAIFLYVSPVSYWCAGKGDFCTAYNDMSCKHTSDIFHTESAQETWCTSKTVDQTVQPTPLMS